MSIVTMKYLNENIPKSWDWLVKTPLKKENVNKPR